MEVVVSLGARGGRRAAGGRLAAGRDAALRLCAGTTCGR